LEAYSRAVLVFAETVPSLMAGHGVKAAVAPSYEGVVDNEGRQCRLDGRMGRLSEQEAAELEQQLMEWMLQSESPTPLAFFRLTNPRSKSAAMTKYSRLLLQACRSNDTLNSLLNKYNNGEYADDWEKWKMEKTKGTIISEIIDTNQNVHDRVNSSVHRSVSELDTSVIEGESDYGRSAKKRRTGVCEDEQNSNSAVDNLSTSGVEVEDASDIQIQGILSKDIQVDEMTMEIIQIFDNFKSTNHDLLACRGIMDMTPK
ncbi:5445_t:CDS:2, partial [Paraglomus occultum]